MAYEQQRACGVLSRDVSHTSQIRADIREIRTISSWDGIGKERATAYGSKPEYGSHVPCCGRYQLRNPFKDTFTHPVEEALTRAKLASDIADIEGFKEERKFIVEYLEPQFQRLLTAESQTVEFIKYEKRPDRLLASDADLHRHAKDHVQAIAEAIILVDNLGAAMKRDMPRDIAIEIRA